MSASGKAANDMKPNVNDLDQHGPEDLTTTMEQECGALTAALERLATGDPDINLPEEGPLPQSVKMRRAINRAAQEYRQAVDMSHEFAMGLAEHFDVLKRVRAGELTARVEGTSELEFVEALKDVTNQTIESVTSTLVERDRALHRQQLLEEQLLQSQKMEAIGRLAGGVAHDFNNILSVIIMCTDLAIQEIDAEHDALQDLLEVKIAGKRAASLVNQLLAFSRKQVLAPENLDLNDTITDMEKMLRRLLGDHIGLDMVLDPRLDRTVADPSQIQQVLANLVVNAGDAMQASGHLLIRTSNEVVHTGVRFGSQQLKPGRHVLMEISDSGEGMAPEVLRHIFESFYTTKDVGKGTGLGLSTVYGIVNQSDGCIMVSSQPGNGTTFKVYLPAADGEIRRRRQTGSEAELSRGAECLLVVEDNRRLRSVAVRILKKVGYDVLEAANGDDALRVAATRQPGSIDLLFTDLVMPLLGGEELAQEIRDLHPEIKIVFTSGYAEFTEDQTTMRDQGEFLQKPYNPQGLCATLHRVLDGGDDHDEL